MGISMSIDWLRFSISSETGVLACNSAVTVSQEPVDYGGLARSGGKLSGVLAASGLTVSNMEQELFHTLTYGQVESSEARSISLKEMPGVYAWYRGFSRLRESTTKEEFICMFSEMAESRLSDRFTGKLGYLYELSIQEHGGGLSKKRMEHLERLASEEAARSCLIAMLESTTFMQSPLYIGKAINLRSRMADHVEGYSDLEARLTDAGIKMTDCLVRYKYVDFDEIDKLSIKEDGHDDVVLLIEEILTRFSPAAFVRRPG
jgi:hypothetical protein